MSFLGAICVLLGMFIVVVIIPAKLIAGHPQQPSFAMIQTIFASDTERTIEGSVGDDKELRLDLGNSINGLYSSDGIELTLSADGFQSIHLPLLPRRPKDWGGTFKDPDTNAELLLKTPFKLAPQTRPTWPIRNRYTPFKLENVYEDKTTVLSILVRLIVHENGTKLDQRNAVQQTWYSFRAWPWPSYLGMIGVAVVLFAVASSMYSEKEE